MQTGLVALVGVILLFVVYCVVAVKLSNRRRRVARQKVLPFLTDTIQAGVKYDVTLSDGRTFLGVEVLGTSDPGDGQFALGGWEGMIVLKASTGKKIYARQGAIRFLVEC